MKQKYLHTTLMVIAFFGLLFYSAQAQEGGANETQEKEIKELLNHPELNLNDDKTLILESDQQKPAVNHPVVKEASSTSKVLGKAKSDKTHPDKEAEEDALSFNFLYYIITKFKISDIVED